MSEPKILFRDNKIKVSSDGDSYTIDHIVPMILILPYTIDSEGAPDQLGVMKESGGFGPIMVEVSDSDSDIFSAAKRGLEEKTGFKLKETDKWDFIGAIKSSSIFASNYPAFSADITAQISDQNENTEIDQDFKLIDVAEALDSDNSLVHSLFLKTFHQNK